MSRNPQKLHAQAQTLLQSNRLQEALALYKKICKQSPTDAQAWHMSGAILGMLGEYDEAQTCCEKVIKLNPHAHGPYQNLANVHMAAGRYTDARRCLDQALKCKPGDSAILAGLGALYIRLKQPDTAIITLQQAIDAFAANHEAHNNLGIAFRDTGDLEAAEKSFRKALDLQPAYVDAWCNLAGIFSDRLEFDQAESCYANALRHSPDNSAALCGLGRLYQSQGEYEKAGITYQKALSRAPADPELLSSLASLHERCGDHEAALKTLAPMIHGNHYNVDSALTYSALCRRLGRHHEVIALLESLLKSPQGKNDEINLLFALGDLYDDIQEFDRAFTCYDKANTLDRANTPQSGHSGYLRSMHDFFTQSEFTRLPRSGNDAQLPVFIVGMPRSGTSLVEQILATHPHVTAGDERGDIIDIIDNLGATTGVSGSYPTILRKLSTEQMDNIAADYLSLIRGFAGDSLRFTDKTPLHGMHLGFINLLLPGSRVIVCKRDPLDTCLSVYFHRFNNFHGYARDLGTLGEFHLTYQRLLQHWRSILDIRIMEVQYEDLVNDSGNMIRSIVDFCGLEWAPECLDFYKNTRTLNTPSYDQVRKPMYASSVARWKNYEKHIAPLREAVNRRDN